MIIIGEKLNATIPAVRKAIIGNDKAFLRQTSIRQEEAGADLIDVNVGTGDGRCEQEGETMQWLVNIVKDSTKKNICIDSADPVVIRTGIEAAMDRAGMINSVKATDGSMSEILPIAAHYGLDVIALAVDSEGIPKTVEGRLRACETIAGSAAKHGIPVDKIYFDPVAMPLSTDTSQGMLTIETLREIKRRIPGAGTVLAASNMSFGLPRRSLINSTMVGMAMTCMVDALIVNPLDTNLMAVVKAGLAIMGKDRHCRKYLRTFRKGAQR